jgi:hypothetical protein
MRITNFATRLTIAAIMSLSLYGHAQTLQVLTVGSSAQFGPFAVAAYELAKRGGATPYHYTIRSGACPGQTCYAYVDDSRTVGGVPIRPNPGSLWVVWSSNGIWAYLSVDSAVGVRAFSAAPRTSLALAALTSLPVSSTSNYAFWADGTNDTALTTAVYNAISGVSFTALNTDILPVDALFATNRILNTLGYGSVRDPRPGHSSEFLIGNAIESAFSADIAVPASFALASGTDPITGQSTPYQYIYPVGAAPVIFLANTLSGSSVQNATGIGNSYDASALFSGVAEFNSVPCAQSLAVGATGPISPVLLEPSSGAMNTVEYSVFVASGGHSQETGVSAVYDNPLQQPCGAATRYRAVGTEDEANAIAAFPSTIGYAFFSYESTGPYRNYNGVSSPRAYKYLQLGGVDPINATYTNGALPGCPVVNGSYNCPITAGQSFLNLRNGTYPAWSIYRMITDYSGQTNVATLVTQAQKSVNIAIPDFVPFTPVCAVSPSGSNDPGLDVYRRHFVPTTVQTTPNTVILYASDGVVGATVQCIVKRATLPALTLGGGSGGGVEAGGDVGGKIIGPFTGNPPYPGPTDGTSPH